jgi:hypothetical protein
MKNCVENLFTVLSNDSFGNGIFQIYETIILKWNTIQDIDYSILNDEVFQKLFTRHQDFLTCIERDNTDELMLPFFELLRSRKNSQTIRKRLL